MKRLVILAAMALVVLAAGAQVRGTRRIIELNGIKVEEARAMRPDTVMPNGEWQRVVQSEMTAKEGFKYMRQVLAKVVPNFQQNVQLEDTTDCKLVVTAALPLMARKKSGYWLHGQYNLALTIAMKDNRYRVSGEDVKCQTGLEVGLNVPGVDTSQGLSFSTIGKDTDGELQRDLQSRVGELLTLIDAMLKKQKADDDF